MPYHIALCWHNATYEIAIYAISYSSMFMSYYGLFSCDLHIIDFRWRSPLCTLPFVDITPVCTTFIFHDSFWHHNGSWHCQGCPIVAQQWVMTLLGRSIMTPQWIMTLLCVHNMTSQWIMTLLGITTPNFAMYYYAKLRYCCFTSKPF